MLDTSRETTINNPKDSQHNQCFKITLILKKGLRNPCQTLCSVELIRSAHESPGCPGPGQQQHNEEGRLISHRNHLRVYL